MQIGERLKEARLEKELSLEDVQKSTKIQTRHLQAIEENNFSLIPGSFYARVFIKEYANAVGLDADELFDEYQDEIPMSDNQIDYSQMQRTRQKTGSTKSSPFATLLPTLVVLILVIGVFFFIWQFALRDDDPPQDPGDQVETDQSAGDQVSLPPDDNGENEGQDDTDTDADESNEDDEDEDDVTDEEPELILDSFENNVSNYRFNTDEESIELVIESESSNWLEVENEAGERLYYATLQSSDSSETFDISEDEYVHLRFGNPGDISISVNGIEVEFSDDMSSTAVQELWIYINEDPA
ncbi:RodZ domain-containing protein [Amphibacillus sp. Q70]|uniref:helix-turn-helix domain-containing protein n=1 Tax=Amphibacillus sp. Q70 TaxID=3453416 RepID=UPI003F85BCDE